MFQKYGDKISFFCRFFPAIRTYISLPCGIGKTNFVKFSIYTFLGSLIWNTMLTYVGIIFGHNWKNIDKYAIYLDEVSAVLSRYSSSGSLSRFENDPKPIRKEKFRTVINVNSNVMSKTNYFQ